MSLNPRPKYREDYLNRDGMWVWKWYNDRMYELEEMMPVIEKAGYGWLSIDKPRFRKLSNGEVEYWFVGIRSSENQFHSVGTQTPLGWYTLGEIIEGVPYRDAYDLGIKKNKAEDVKNTKKYRAGKVKPKRRVKKRKKKSSDNSSRDSG